MAQFSRSELVDGHLPLLCLRCGQPTDSVQDHTFTWHSRWLYLLLVVGVIPYFLIRVWARKRYPARVPMCRKHRNHWRRRRVAVWTGTAVFMGLTIAGLWLAVSNPSRTAAIILIAGTDGMLLWAAVAISLQRKSIHATAIGPASLRLEGVAPQFIEAMQHARAARGAPLEIHRCARCGLESPLLTAFQRIRNRLFCPPCWQKRHRRFLKVVLFAEIGVGTAGLVLLLAGSHAPFGWELTRCGWALINFWVMAVSEMLVVVPHEAGHALAAWLLGARVFRICIGSGNTALEWRWRGLPIEIKMIPLGGATLFGLPTPRFARTRSFLIVLAGPLTHIVILAVLYRFVPPQQWFSTSFVNGFAPVDAFVFANLIVLTANLLPFQGQWAGVPIPSDGLALLTIPFRSEAAVRNSRAAYFALEGGECLAAGQYDRAVAWYEQGLQIIPENMILRLNLGVALLKAEKFARARKEWLTVLESEELPLVLQALTHNNLAVADVLLEGTQVQVADSDVDLLAEADRFSAAAEQSLPWNSHARGTRGCVLVALGRIDEGRSMLEEVLPSHEEISAKAFCNCFLAVAAAKQGRVDEARAYVEAAEKLDPHTVALPKARHALVTATT